MIVFEQYTVVTSDDLGKFEDRINQLLSEGWALQGGVAVCPMTQSSESCIHMQWSQAMALPSRNVPAVSLQEEEFPLPRSAELHRIGELPSADLG
ncbi:DUF1737 domain-containing protein [Luteolibacter arcticus]|uniref:DUF1737 domain-containing protein n=1 Tax=Luteolibacter arcticus TaxID=1581411 RepID=A0ABT3GMM1_9BACT|nr:DUF1737 domain-containing protein [Luteolibacter arcticus]MCW1924747.1 DUF1737 domain-containing protein [Luteolibacter arcticus]